MGILELDGVAAAPSVADAASRKSMIFEASMLVWSCLRMKFSMDLLDFSISRAARKSGFRTIDSRAFSDLVLNNDNSNFSSKSSSSRYLKIASQERDLNTGVTELS